MQELQRNILDVGGREGTEQNLRLQGAEDATMRDQQAGFRKDRSCIDQVATLRIIIEQPIEWNTSLYVNFFDFEKAFDVLWCLMRHQRNSFE